MVAPNLPRASTTVPLGVRVPLADRPSNLGIEWDAENRLIAVKEGPSTLASFTYGASGRRATKTAGAVTTTYVYDGAQFLEERPSSGPTKRYAYGPGIDQPQAQSVGGVASYFAADHLGSVARLTDAAGTPTLTREYDPWGRLVQGSATSGYAFTGREWDPEAGLYYYRARYYDPTLGRFVSEDPAGFSTGTNRYTYANNNPTLNIDPTGEYVEVRCREIRRTLIGSAPGVHCYLYVKCENEIPPTLVGYLLPAYIAPDYLEHGDPNNQDVVADRLGFYRGYRTFTQSGTESCLVKRGGEMARAGYRIRNYKEWGPNSNTYAAWLLRSCGGSCPAPQRAVGWDYPQGWTP